MRSRIRLICSCRCCCRHSILRKEHCHGFCVYTDEVLTDTNWGRALGYSEALLQHAPLRNWNVHSNTDLYLNLYLYSPTWSTSSGLKFAGLRNKKILSFFRSNIFWSKCWKPARQRLLLSIRMYVKGPRLREQGDFQGSRRLVMCDANSLLFWVSVYVTSRRKRWGEQISRGRGPRSSRWIWQYPRPPPPHRGVNLYWHLERSATVSTTE